MENVEFELYPFANRSSRLVLFEVCNLIPRGRVCSYGQIGDVVTGLTGKNIRGQIAGWMLSGMKKDDMAQYAWQRVIARDGYISTLKLGFRGQDHIDLLRSEGVEVVDEIVDMARFGLKAEEMEEIGRRYVLENKS
jgi:alkylated DNA nucleotide flippase Atl1